jgi:hypothetical protein
MSSRHETQQGTGYCEFVSTSTGEAVVALPTAQQAMRLEPAKANED